MNEEKMQNVDSSSTKFNEGVEAGLNSSEDTRNWQAGNELGQDLRDDNENTRSKDLPKKDGVPLFMRNSGIKKSSDQDEKDESAE
jgi:hypothetical protein